MIYIKFDKINDMSLKIKGLYNTNEVDTDIN